MNKEQLEAFGFKFVGDCSSYWGKGELSASLENQTVHLNWWGDSGYDGLESRYYPLNLSNLDVLSQMDWLYDCIIKVADTLVECDDTGKPYPRAEEEKQIANEQWIRRQQEVAKKIAELGKEAYDNWLASITTGRGNTGIGGLCVTSVVEHENTPNRIIGEEA